MSRIPAPLLLLAGPLALLLCSEGLRRDQAPYWRSSMQDTTYAYVFNALELAELRPPPLTLHPGTTVEIVGALVIRLRHLALGAQPLPADLLSDPEPYCRAVHRVLIAAFPLVMLAGGLFVLRATRDLGAALAVQLTPLLTGGAITLFSGGVSPEPLLLTLGAALAAVACGHALGERPGRGLAVAGGILAGLGVATKMTFLPVAVLPLLLLEERRARLLWGAVALGTFALAMAPAWPSLGDWLGFAYQVATRENLYRPGGGRLPGIGQYLTSLRHLLGGRYDPLFPVLVLLGGVAVVATARQARQDPAARRPWRALAAATFVCVMQVVLVAKDPLAPKRYLVPAFGLAGLNAALLLALLRRRLGSARANAAMAAVLVVGGALGLAGTAYRSRLLREQWRAVSSIPAFLSQADAGCRTVRYAGSSSLEWAVYHGDSWAAQRFSAPLRALYPDNVVYDPARAGFFLFDRAVPLEEVRGPSGCVLLWGFVARRRGSDPSRPDFWRSEIFPPSFDLELLHQAGPEAVYRLRELRSPGGAAGPRGR